MTCPDLPTLSQLLDGELDTPPLRGHLGTCPTCTAWAARVRRAARAVAEVAVHAASAGDRAPGCPSSSQLVAWLDPTAPADAGRAVTAHLDACDGCLAEALSAARTARRLAAGPEYAVPEALRARVASRWPAAASEPSLTTLVLAVTRAGAVLVERHLAAPFRQLVATTRPVPALRAVADVATLQFELRADGARIRTTVVPAGDGVNVTIVLAGEAGAPLSAQRVSIQRHGRVVFSARTDAAGQIDLPALERGVYEVSCPGVSAAFRLDLRGSH